MPDRRLLFLDAAGISASHWQLGQLRTEGSFSHDDDGIDAFGHYLRQHRHSQFYLLADVAEEGFQFEDIPPIHGADRSALITRKLGQYFYGTPLSVAISLGRNKTGRHDEKVLFAALTRYQQFEPWLLAMREAEAQLAGLYSMPMAVAALVPQLGRSHRQLLILSTTRSGLRQTFFEDGQLRFSRLTAMVTGTMEETAIACVIEAEKIYQYLAGQRLLARGTPLLTLVLAHPEQFAAIRGRCRDSDDLHFDFLDLVAETAKAGLKTPPTDSGAESLFLHLLVRQTPRQQFAPALERRFFRLWQIRFGLQSAGLITLAACLLLAAEKAYDAYELQAQAPAVRGQIETDRQRYAEALQTLPKIPISTDNLRALIDRYEILARRSPRLEPLLEHLSHALAKRPTVELSRLDWRLARGVDDTGAPGAGRATAVATASAGHYVLLDVSGQLPQAMANDHRAQLETINGLAEDLRSRPGIQVRILKQPFEVESGRSFKSAADSTGQHEAPRFTLRLVQSL